MDEAVYIPALMATTWRREARTIWILMMISANSSKKRRDIDVNGFYDVIAHGTTRTIQIQHNGISVEITHRTAARLIAKDPNYKGRSIRLLSCDTGGISRGFAQGLADRLNVVVKAPTKLVWVRPDGSYFVAGRSKTNPNLPDKNNRGRFVKFYPRGAKK